MNKSRERFPVHQNWQFRCSAHRCCCPRSQQVGFTATIDHPRLLQVTSPAGNNCPDTVLPTQFPVLPASFAWEGTQWFCHFCSMGKSLRKTMARQTLTSAWNLFLVCLLKLTTWHIGVDTWELTSSNWHEKWRLIHGQKRQTVLFWFELSLIERTSAVGTHRAVNFVVFNLQFHKFMVGLVGEEVIMKREVSAACICLEHSKLQTAARTGRRGRGSSAPERNLIYPPNSANIANRVRWGLGF